jgi:hypothetical protein
MPNRFAQWTAALASLAAVRRKAEPLRQVREQTMSHATSRLALLLLTALASMSVAAIQRTFVATSGLDGDPCTLAQPCRSFATAITAADAGGEVIVLDSGGYGPVTITKSITIAAPQGVYAGVTANGVDGVVVNGAGISVVLRGLSINGLGAINGTGVKFLQGARLHVERCDVSGMTTAGIDVQAEGATVHITDLVLRANNEGLVAKAGGAGTAIFGERVRVERSTGDGVALLAPVNLTLRDSWSVANQGSGIGVFLNGPGLKSRIELDNVTASANGGAGVTLIASGDTTTLVSASVTRGLIADNGSYGLWTTSNFASALALVQIALSDSVVRGNASYGVFSSFGASGSYLIATRNTIHGNTLDGIRTFNSSFQSRGDNAIYGNNGGGTQTTGPITLLTGV